MDDPRRRLRQRTKMSASSSPSLSSSRSTRGSSRHHGPLAVKHESENGRMTRSRRNHGLENHPKKPSLEKVQPLTSSPIHQHIQNGTNPRKRNRSQNSINNDEPPPASGASDVPEPQVESSGYEQDTLGHIFGRCTKSHQCARELNHPGVCNLGHWKRMHNIKPAKREKRALDSLTFGKCVKSDKCSREKNHPGVCNFGDWKRMIKHQRLGESSNHPSTNPLADTHQKEPPRSPHQVHHHRSPTHHHPIPEQRQDPELMEIDSDDDELILENLWEIVKQRLRPITQGDIFGLERIREECATFTVTNARYLESNDALLGKILSHMKDEVVVNPNYKIEFGRRGHDYHEKWKEKAFVEAHENVVDHASFDAYTDLVYGYGADEFQDFLTRSKQSLASTCMSSSSGLSALEPGGEIWHPTVPVQTCHPAAWGQNFSRLKDTTEYRAEHNHPGSIEVDCIQRWEEERYEHHCLTSLARDQNTTHTDSCSSVYGSSVDEDDIYAEMQHVLRHLTNVCALNWNRMKDLYELTRTEVDVQPFHDRDARLSRRLERFYQVLYPESDASAPRFVKMRSTSEDVLKFVTKHASPESTAVIAQASQFAMTLQRGFPVDALDKNGNWCHAMISDLYVEGEEMLRFVKVHYDGRGEEFDEWISAFAGRILPKGMCVTDTPMTEDRTAKNENDATRDLSMDITPAPMDGTCQASPQHLPESSDRDRVS